MTILSRVKERLETDLSDTELDALIAEATTEIQDRYGPPAPSSPGTLTVLLDGGFKSVFPSRPISAITTITETVGVTETVLAADDFRIRNGGRRIERLNSGTNPRHSWGRLVEIAYTPVDDTKQRGEVTIKLVNLSLSYRGLVKGERVGDTTSSLTSDSYQRERETLLASLGPKVRLA